MSAPCPIYCVELDWLRNLERLKNIGKFTTAAALAPLKFWFDLYKVPLPDPATSDGQYFDDLRRSVNSLGIRLCLLVPPLTAPPHSERSTPHAPTLYALRKGLGVWHLTFDGQDADIKHERALLYVAWLLYHPPPEPIHAVDLAAKIPELYRRQLGLTALTDPATGKVAPLLSGARLQERSLALDDAETMRALYRKEKQLEAILDSDDASEPEKAEALRELEEIAEFQRHHAQHSKDAARRAVDTVRKAIRRLHHRLARALDTKGHPHPVLRPFAEYLDKHIIIPSARTALAARLTHEPPPGIAWTP